MAAGPLVATALMGVGIYAATIGMWLPRLWRTTSTALIYLPRHLIFTRAADMPKLTSGSKTNVRLS